MTEHNQASRVRRSGVSATTAKKQAARAGVQLSASTVKRETKRVTKLPTLVIKHP